MNLAVWAYDKDQYWLIDAIDVIKGTKYCEKQWELHIREKNGDINESS